MRVTKTEHLCARTRRWKHQKMCTDGQGSRSCLELLTPPHATEPLRVHARLCAHACACVRAIITPVYHHRNRQHRHATTQTSTPPTPPPSKLPPTLVQHGRQGVQTAQTNLPRTIAVHPRNGTIWTQNGDHCQTKQSDHGMEAKEVGCGGICIYECQ